MCWPIVFETCVGMWWLVNSPIIIQTGDVYCTGGHYTYWKLVICQLLFAAGASAWINSESGNNIIWLIEVWNYDLIIFFSDWKFIWIFRLPFRWISYDYYSYEHLDEHLYEYLDEHLEEYLDVH